MDKSTTTNRLLNVVRAEIATAENPADVYVVQDEHFNRFGSYRPEHRDWATSPEYSAAWDASTDDERLVAEYILSRLARLVRHQERGF